MHSQARFQIDIQPNRGVFSNSRAHNLYKTNGEERRDFVDAARHSSECHSSVRRQEGVEAQPDFWLVLPCSEAPSVWEVMQWLPIDELVAIRQRTIHRT